MCGYETYRLCCQEVVSMENGCKSGLGANCVNFEKINAIPPQILIGCFIILFDLDVVYEKGGCNTICVTGSKTLFIVPLTGNTCETRGPKRRCCCFWATKVTAISPNRNRHKIVCNKKVQYPSCSNWQIIQKVKETPRKQDNTSALFNSPKEIWMNFFALSCCNDFGGDFGLEKSQLLLLLKNNNSDVFGPLFSHVFPVRGTMKSVLEPVTQIVLQPPFS